MPKMDINLEVREVLSPFFEKNTLLFVETQPSFETTHTGSKIKDTMLCIETGYVLFLSGLKMVW